MTGLVLASRGDPLSAPLFAELARRYPISMQIRPDLTPTQRMAVAAATFHPVRVRWAERFWKSSWGYRLRSANAARYRRATVAGAGPVLQVHALFEVPDAPTLLYVDCTHRQAAEQWPAWNPLRGRALTRWYEREGAAYRGAVHIFAFSRQTAASLVGDYGVAPERVSVVGAAANLAPHAAAPGTAGPDRAETDARAGTRRPPTILFVGNDFARKGGPVLLEAFTELRRRFPDARLRLVGTDPGVRPGPGVEVLGRIREPGQLDRLFADADVFCLPSVFDPLPGALLEAMSHGLPCVTTATCGIADVITSGRDGLIVPGQDAPALAAALAALLADPELGRRIGTAGESRVRSEFTWERVVDRMAPALNRCLELPHQARLPRLVAP